jgi:hypothetical protein
MDGSLRAFCEPNPTYDIVPWYAGGLALRESLRFQLLPRTGENPTQVQTT